jgi:hypothetical protein
MVIIRNVDYNVLDHHFQDTVHNKAPKGSPKTLTIPSPISSPSTRTTTPSPYTGSSSTQPNTFPKHHCPYTGTT